MLCHTQSNWATYMMPNVNGTITPTYNRAYSMAACPPCPLLRSPIRHLYTGNQRNRLQCHERNDGLYGISGRHGHRDVVRRAAPGALVAASDVARTDRSPTG